MAKFLNTKKAVSEIEDLIRDADQKLILISPYLRLSKDFRELLTYRNNIDKITTIIFGKQDLNPNEMKFLQGLRFVILKYNQDLHAKCYLNDNKMIITSLNLYEFSMNNNKEMGVLIDLNDEPDNELFEDALREIDYIDKTSERFEFTSIPDDIKSEKKEPETLTKTSSSYNSKLLTTKEISQLTGISSRKVNAWFVDNKLMYKEEEDWIATKKGKELGCSEKEGQYGKFVVWPEDVLDELKLN
ncbi:phospholipase D family protein [Arenibacter sp. F20364]|uniref:phospholipase D family protein n=1 Tax=Arenibacter sp. F20364 TaxID=2926415 RepID=UPI001FF64FE4|nr:phospholipase D family protein [Arenibacter sp. F20364]MCK0192991.1 phospholipase D family protein [Arenibacter sp. F20364]